MQQQSRQPPAGDRSSRQAYFLFALLWFAVLFAFVDKTILSLVLSAIQTDLGLSDSRLGFLAGAAFGITYMIGALVNGTIADRSSRTGLITVMLVIWSLATVFCGLIHGFGLLVLFRGIIGFAEGGLNPTAASLVGDTFPKHARATALAVLFSAVGGGIMITFVAGGPLLQWLASVGPISVPVLGELAHWQMGFILVGVPGLLLAALMLTTVREPARTEQGATAAGGDVEWRSLLVYLRSHARLYVGILVGMPITVLGAYALLPWMPVLLKRVHAWDVASVGLIYGLTSGPAMIAGSLIAGRLVAKLRQRGHADASYRFCIISSFWLIGLTLLGILLANAIATITLVALGFLMFMVPPAMMYAVINEVAPNRMRARLGGLALVSAGLILNSLGPWRVGLLNDYVFKTQSAIGYSILCISIPSVLLGGYLLIRGLPQYAAAAAEAAARQSATERRMTDEGTSLEELRAARGGATPRSAGSR